MLSFLAMLFTLQSGVGATPVSGAASSLREQALAVAAEQVERGAPPERAPAFPAAPGQQGETPHLRVITREEWRGMLCDLLVNERLASAAMWVMDQPLSVDVSGDKVFVSLRLGNDR